MRAYRFILLIVTAALASPAIVSAEILYKDQAGVCETTYKQANGTKCVNIQGAGAVVGCATAGTPTMTNNNGVSSVGVTYSTDGTGKYSWNNVGNCIPNPTSCSIICKKKTKSDAGAQSVTESSNVNDYCHVVEDLFFAAGSGNVATAVNTVKTEMGQVVNGPLFDTTAESAVVAELDARVAASDADIQATEVPLAEAACEAMMLDHAGRYGDPIPTVSTWGVAVMILLILSAATIVMKRRLAPT